MKTKSWRRLTMEAFAPYGSFAPMIDPDTVRIGAPPIEFYRDMVQSTLGTATVASFGVCRVSRRPQVIDVSEYHDTACETLLPLDGDILMHVAPAVPEKEFPFAHVEVFLVPKGTLVVLRPGVWHHGPFVRDTDVVNCLVMLPERLYMNDCHMFVFPESEWMTIAMEEHVLDGAGSVGI